MVRQYLQAQLDQILGQVNDGFLIFKKEAEVIQVYYPDLTLDVFENDKLQGLSGTIQLEDEKGSFIDCYKIKVIPTLEYPYRFPHVFETGGRIPNNIDWHVYPDGHCCISSIPEEILICKNGISLSGFIENQLKPYLFNQKYRELNGFFLKERPHGNEGNIQFFSEVLKTKDLNSILNGLKFIRQRKVPNRVSKCFCGSNLKYRKCHREAYHRLSAFNDKELDVFINMIMEKNKSE